MNIDAKKKAQYQTSLTQNYYNRIIIYVLIMHNEYPEAVVIDSDNYNFVHQVAPHLEKCVPPIDILNIFKMCMVPPI